MGDRLTEEEEQTSQTAKSYGDIFDELFPHYLLFGMTPEQYWDGESELKKAYRKAYALRIENERRIADTNNWYLGQYMIAVLQSGAMLVPGVNTKTGATFEPYPEVPFLQKAEEAKKEENRKKREEEQQKLALAMFQSMTQKLNKNILKRLEREKEEKARESGSTQ